MFKNWLKNENGESNIVSMLILIALFVALAFLFKSYIQDILESIWEKIFG